MKSCDSGLAIDAGPVSFVAAVFQVHCHWLSTLDYIIGGWKCRVASYLTM